MTFTFALPTEWSLTITAVQREAAGRYSQSLQYHRRDAYLNALCCDVFLTWFQTEYDPQAATWLPTPEQQGLWGIVSGSVVTVGRKRLLLLPVETSETETLEIPQEWIDVPTWAADYILAVQVDPEGAWLTVWGYTTHQAVKTLGDYDGCDRTYSLEASDLLRDLNAFSQILRHCPEASTLGEIAPLPILDDAQAHQLIERLGHPDLAFPRQALPFQQWGALLNEPTWRRQLAAQRSGSPSAASAVIHLADWFQSVVGDVWQTVEALLGERAADCSTNLRRDEPSHGPMVKRAKQIELTSASNSVTLLMQLNLESDDRLGVSIQLHPHLGATYVPEGIELSLYSPTGKILQSIQAEAQDDYIQLTRFRCPPSTRFQVQIQLGELVIVEPFVV